MKANQRSGAGADRPEQYTGWMYLFSVLNKRRGMILAVTTAFVIVGVAAAFLMPKQYQAEAEVLVEKVSETDKAILFGVNIPDLLNRVDWLNSEIQIIKSYPVAEAVVRKLNLQKLIQESAPADEEEARILFQEAVTQLRKDIDVAKVGSSNVLRLKYEARDPQLAADVLAETISAYKGHRARMFRESAELQFFTNQLEMADKNLRQLESNLTNYKRESEVTEPAAQAQLLTAKLADYQASLNAAQTTRIGKEARLTIIREKLKANADTGIPATDVSDSPSRADYITKLRSELLDLEIERDALLQKYSPEYSEVVELQSKIASTREKLRAEIREIIAEEETSISVLKAQEARLQRTMDSIRASIGKLSEQDYEIAQLSRGIEDTRDLYSVLLKQREEARLSMAKAQSGMRIHTVSPPVPPIQHSRPNKKITVALALLLGLFISASSALAGETLNELRTGPRPLEGSGARQIPETSRVLEESLT